MDNPQKPHREQLGRDLLDQLSEGLSQHVKGRRKSDNGKHQSLGGFVRSFSNRFSAPNDSDALDQTHQFSHQEVRLLLLSLLANKPAHGYELIKELEARSNGCCTASPGIVYPTLTHLDELGYITIEADGDRKRHVISKAGKHYLTNHEKHLDELWITLSHPQRTYRHEPKVDENNAWLPELIAAKNALMDLLTHYSNAPITEQQRITEVLLQATRTIRLLSKP